MLRRVLITGAIVSSFLLAASASFAQEGPQVLVRLDGAAVNGSPSPLRIDASEPVQLAVRVDNPTADPIVVSHVRLRVRALGITYLGARADIDGSVPAGANRSFRAVLDVRGFGALGLLPASVEVMDARGALIATTRMTADVRGSILSGFGLLGIALMVITLLGLATLCTRVLQDRMPSDPATRARLYAAVGIGGGASIAFLGAVGRVVSMRAGTTVLLMIAGAAVLAAIGVGSSSEPLTLPRPRIPGFTPDDVAEIDLTERVGRYITVDRTSARVG